MQLLGAGDGQVGSGAAAAERVGHAAERAERGAAEMAVFGWQPKTSKNGIGFVVILTYLR